MHTSGLSLTQLAHNTAAPLLQDGDFAVDATAGNGHDTVFLASAVGPSGHVCAFDVQQAALDATRARLEKAGLTDRVTLIAAGHETIPAHLPPDWKGTVAAVLFNLGYLPGGDHSIITRSKTTLPALHAAITWLRPGGLLSVLVYPGHPGGADEAQAVRRELENLKTQGKTEAHACHGDPSSETHPWLFTGNKL
ncbi:MAG: methyltransferase domain-containing protein [Puniceicoccales bacterium]|jgi:16S rRNA C1402 N4-methylase RsmH|nr:methyltransferase domain-containing protein [Puniceicoccales bacterium]